MLRFLLGQACWFAEAYNVDGFRFDSVSSALYRHRSLHGRGKFDGGYADFFGAGAELDAAALTYFKLVNWLTHDLVAPPLLTIAEEHSGLPGLCAPVGQLGVGFDLRLAMGLPPLCDEPAPRAAREPSSARDALSPPPVRVRAVRARCTTAEAAAPCARAGRRWERICSEADHARPIDVVELAVELCRRRAEERRLAYCENHDGSFVGGQSLAFRLMGAHMYEHMSVLRPPPTPVARGVALHKLARLLTCAPRRRGPPDASTPIALDHPIAL